METDQCGACFLLLEQGDIYLHSFICPLGFRACAVFLKLNQVLKIELEKLAMKAERRWEPIGSFFLGGGYLLVMQTAGWRNFRTAMSAMQALQLSGLSSGRFFATAGDTQLSRRRTVYRCNTGSFPPTPF